MSVSTGKCLCASRTCHRSPKRSRKRLGSNDESDRCERIGAFRACSILEDRAQPVYEAGDSFGGGGLGEGAVGDAEIASFGEAESGAGDDRDAVMADELFDDLHGVGGGMEADEEVERAIGLGEIADVEFG